MASNPDAPQRLFVALPVPEPVRAVIAVATGPVREQAGRALRWTRPDAYHLTLTFLGSVEGRRSVDLEARLGRAAHRCPPLALELAGPGRFGRRVLWIGIAGDRQPLVRLAAGTSAAARRAGIDVETRPYRPHLTLARGDGSVDLEPVATALGAALDALPAAVWTAHELQLVRSELGAGPGGSARHDVVARWPLDGPHAPR